MAHERPVDPPPQDPSTETVHVARTSARLPDRIGRYHIKRAIASGGMGTVYEAAQDNPRRVVAVKVMKQGIASKSALRRFEYEGQILGRLRHPGIAQIYEAGTHDDGHGAVPYFAMEYIPNAKPITKFAEEKKLGTRQRMELFAKVCDAIHHGHQKGIIHRDLKPGNILVDSTGQVKIIDFGVARSTDSDMAVTTLQTDVGQLIGTLQYMSPEQCEADPHDIDIRSDVYALGVVFYEMLCGKLPYDLTRMALHHATSIIREQHPTKLSTLDRTLRGDVETIALKGLEKERERRYQSAADFGHDIERYLSGDAILARPASIVYQLRLFARRNKGVVTAIAALFVILVTATIVSTSLYMRSEAARRDAVEARDLAQRGFRGRTYWYQRSEEGIRQAINYFEEAIQKNPDYALAHAALAESYVVVAGHNLGPSKEALEKARTAALKAVELDETVGEAHNVLGIVKRAIDWDYPGAEREFRRAIELNPGHATAHQWFAESLMGMGRVDESFDELRRAQELDPLSLPGKTSAALLHYYARRYDQAIEHSRRVLELDPNFAMAREHLARAYIQKGMHAQAIEVLRAGGGASDTNPRLVAALGIALAAAGMTDEARGKLVELQELSRGRYVSPYYMALVHAAIGETDSAFECLRRACDDRSADLRFFKVDPALDTLRSDPRFDDLLRRMNLAP